ncbi:MAG: aspartate kinase [Prevotellaceae bacterium]|nr:aspartate kinase [Prevotellaceae bacterium]
MIVMKFGGTSVGSPERIKSVVNLVNDDKPKIVVLSAMSGTTNSLVKISGLLYDGNKEADAEIDQLEDKYKAVVNELYGNEENRKRASGFITRRFNLLRSFSGHPFTAVDEYTVLAQGELLSTTLTWLYCEELEIDSVLLPALSFMRIDRNGEPDSYYIREQIDRELKLYPDVKLFITQGFICKDASGEISNLKRGGSDYSASLIGNAINADEIQIWTDIDGFHNNDPRYVKGTKAIRELSFSEAAELAYFGAKILHPASVWPAQEADIPLLLKNTMEPEAPGTIISSKTVDEGIKAIAAKDNITAIKIKSGRMLMAYGFLRKVFEVFESYQTPIDMITTSEIAVSLTIDNTVHLDKIIRELKLYGSVGVDRKMTIICIVGNNIMHCKDSISKVFKALENVPVRMISYGGSRHNISILTDSEHKLEALNQLNKYLFTDGRKRHNHPGQD